LKFVHKVIIVLLLAGSGAFTFWYLNTVTLTGRVVDTEGKVLPYVIYGEVYRIGDNPLFTFNRSTDEKGKFKLENVRRGELCISYSYHVAKGNNTYQLNLLEKCAVVEPFEDRDVGDIVIDIDEALRLTIFKELKNSRELIVITHHGEKKKVQLKGLSKERRMKYEKVN